MLKIADVSFPSQKSIIQNISLSKNTISSRTNELAGNLVLQLKEKIKKFTSVEQKLSRIKVIHSF